jgi:acid phosphatase family membrane protein YuiD
MASEPVAAWLLVTATSVGCQLLKFLLHSAAARRIQLRPLVTANGLPSLYGTAFGCLSAVVGMRMGFDSPAFAVVGLLSGIVLHDAIRVQTTASRGGRAAHELASSLGHPSGRRWLDGLRPSLADRGHRPWHVVVGVLLGVLAALGFGGRSA